MTRTLADHPRSIAREDLPNQPPRMPEHDAWSCDESLRWWVGWAAPETKVSDLASIGPRVGSWHAQDLANQANDHPPLVHDGDVTLVDAWHELLGDVFASGITGMPRSGPGGYVRHLAAFELWARLDIGVMCPVSMTAAAIPVLRTSAQTEHWVDRLAAANAQQATAGMAMTEPQGGSDVGDSTTTATTDEHGAIRINGFKWFLSHPTADVFLVLAREDGLPAGSRGLSCFAVPGVRADGQRNGIVVERLKDKLGTRSLASAEARFVDAEATRIGERGDGVRTIIDMVVHTRMHCVAGSCGVMTRAVQEAVHYCAHRSAFGAQLIDQPLMRATLARIAVEREASLALLFELARSADSGSPLTRLVTAIAKFHVTRQAVRMCIEAVECLGGNGYTEEFVVARLYRDAQVNSTWEGSGNVMVLDVYRALDREPQLLDMLRDRIVELAPDRHDLAAAVPDRVPDHEHGRAFVGNLATSLQQALLHHRASVTGNEADRAASQMLDAGAYVDGGDALVSRVLRSVGTSGR
jgi:putative acyl-CoA dehydrogenase